MVAKELFSLQHPLVLEAVSIRKEREARERSNLALVIGRKMADELAVEVLFTAEREGLPPARETYFVTEEILAKITGLKKTDGYAALVKKPKESDLTHKTKLLFLDQLQDPGNVGTLFRSALALGWEGIGLLPGSVDPFNDKALRAAKGATFRLPYQTISLADFPRHTLYAAHLSGIPLDKVVPTPPFALLLSQEGRGLLPTQGAIQVQIPMAGAMESLNVAAAGAIFLYTWRGGR